MKKKGIQTWDRVDQKVVSLPNSVHSYSLCSARELRPPEKTRKLRHLLNNSTYWSWSTGTKLNSESTIHIPLENNGIGFINSWLVGTYSAVSREPRQWPVKRACAHSEPHLASFLIAWHREHFPLVTAFASNDFTHSPTTKIRAKWKGGERDFLSSFSSWKKVQIPDVKRFFAIERYFAHGAKYGSWSTLINISWIPWNADDRWIGCGLFCNSETYLSTQSIKAWEKW